MTNSDSENKFSIQIGKVTGGDFQIGDRTYYAGKQAPDPSAIAPETPDTSKKHTILFLASSPADQARLRLDVEYREIDEGMRRSQRRDDFNLEQKWAVRVSDLHRALLDYHPQIVHFSGHGGDKAGLILENEVGDAKYVSTDALDRLFKLFANRGLECVILNACYSEEQAKAIAQHIPFVIGMSEAIKDKTAIKFAVGFYDAVGAGWPYVDAYEMGCSAIALEDILQEHIPKLHGRDVE